MANLSDKIAPSGVVTGLSDLGITATATELNTLDGITATTTELNHTDGVTSNIQTQLDGKASTADVASAVPAGTVSFVAMSSAPTGWLKANGAAVSRTTYASLFSAIGTTFGAGNGSTTFNLPDLRGEFIRGWDNGRGVDSGRGFGSFQNFQLGNHRHLSGVIVRSNSASPYGYVAGNSNTWDRHQNYANDRHNYTQTVGGSSNGSESRPRNRALLACVKF